MPGHQFESTSTTLLARLRSGQVGSWERLTRLYGPLVRYWCRKWGVPDADADDVVQEIWVGLGPTLAGFRDGGGRSFRGWMRGIAHHKAQDWHRRQARQPADAAGGTVMVQMLQQVEAFEGDLDPPDPEEEAQSRALHARAISEIREEFEVRTWQIFLAVAVEGKPVPDVAAEFAISPAGVRKVKSRVFHRLRQELGELME